jgi:hypothetical protein
MIYKILIRIPLLGSLLEIVNSYVANGDFSADHGFAPFFYWVKSLWAEVFASIALVLLMVWPYCSLVENRLIILFPPDVFVRSPGSLSTSVLPNILGFGIGVYALIFALSSNFVKKFNDKVEEENKNGDLASIFSLNSSMAYPLLVIAFAILIGVVQQAYKDNNWLIFGSWFLFWYSIICTIVLIGSLFSMGGLSLLDKIDE